MPDSANYHIQLINEERQSQKQRWYQALEIHEHNQDPVTTFRQYNNGTLVSDQADISLRRDIIQLINCIPRTADPFPWWYNDILQWLGSGGGDKLRWADIWDVNWKNYTQDPASIPQQSLHHKLLIHWLRLTQRHRTRLPVRAIDKLVKLFL